MKKLSINQINSYAVNSGLLQYYNSVGRDRSNYRNRYFKYMRENGKVWESPIIKNCMFGALMRDFEDKTGVHYSDSKRVCVDMEYRWEYRGVYVVFSCGLNGVRYHVQGMACGAQEQFRSAENVLNILPKSGVVRSNSTWKEFDGEKWFRDNILAKYLYAVGRWRNVQISAGISKEEMRQLYKREIGRKYKACPAMDIGAIESSVVRHMRKKYRIKFVNYERVAVMFAVARKFGVQARVITAAKFSPYALYEEAISNFDTEEEIIAYAEGEIMSGEVLWY